jgi:hypothetical protein
MNAPLPLHVTRSGPQTYEQVARISNEVAARLAERLTSQTQGEVLFSAADRGRYATDASIYQAMPVGVFVPRSSADVTLALEILPRSGGAHRGAWWWHQPVRPDRGRGLDH